MRIRHPRTAVVVLAILCVAASVPAQQTLALDWKVTHISPANGATFFENATVTIRCEWNAAIVTGGNFVEPVAWDGWFVVDDAVSHYFSVKYEPGGQYYWKPGTTNSTAMPWEKKTVHGTATNEFHGIAESTWVAKGVGPHTVGCRIAMSSAVSNPLEPASKKANNTAAASIVVNPVGQVTPGIFPHSPEPVKPPRPVRQPQKAAQPVVPKPSLSIIGAQAKFDPACVNIANLVTVQVKIQNTSVPLAPGKGTVSVKENGGANLGATMSLPAIAQNEAKVVTIPVGTLTQFTSALPGQHQLTIALNPATAGGQSSFVKAGSDYQLPLTLPPAYCAAR